MQHYSSCRLLLDRRPLRVFLGDGGLDAFRQQSARIRDSCIGSGQGEIDELLVLQRLAGGSVVVPVLLVLVEVQQAFEDGDEHTQTSCDELIVAEGERREERDRRGGDDFDNFDALEGSLRRTAFSVVPGNLVFKPVENRIGFWVG